MKNGYVIVNYNDFETTSKLLNNIKSYSVLDKIIIVDNCSTDDSYQQLINLPKNDKIVVLKSKENNGYASGINMGCKYLNELYKSCYIVISNADIEIKSEEDIKRLIECKQNDFAIVAPIIKEHKGYNRGWRIPTPLQDAILNVVYLHGYLRPKMLFYSEDYYNDELVNVQAVSGCFFLVDSKYLEKIGYFDEQTFLYYEENIIAKKIQEINMKIMINTNVVVFHNHSVTIDKSISHLKKYKELKKSQYYFQKVYNEANFFECFMLKTTSYFSYIIIKTRSLLIRKGNK